MNDIYDLDDKIELLTQSYSQQFNIIQKSITDKNKHIADLECPRDSSLDNSVIVWISSGM